MPVHPAADDELRAQIDPTQTVTLDPKTSAAPANANLQTSPDPLPATPRVVEWKMPDPLNAVHVQFQFNDVAPPAPTIAAKPPFDFEKFFDALATIAQTRDADELSTWLQAQPALWSLQFKAGIGRATIAALREKEPRMSNECFDALLRFFDLDHVLAGLDAVATQRLRRRLNLHWNLQPENISRLLTVLRAKPAVVSGIDETRIFLRDLWRPALWPQIFRATLQPGYAQRIADFIRRLCHGHLDELPISFGKAKLEFWLKAGDRSRLSYPRLIVGGLMCANLFVCLSLLGLTAALTAPDSSWVVLPAIGGALCCLWMTLLAWQALSAWQIAKQAKEEHGYRFWSRLIFIPTLAGLGVAINSCASPYAGFATISFAVAFATVRFRHRKGLSMWPNRNSAMNLAIYAPAIVIGIAAINIYDLDLSDYLCNIYAAIAAALWLADLWMQRRQLRVATT